MPVCTDVVYGSACLTVSLSVTSLVDCLTELHAPYTMSQHLTVKEVETSVPEIDAVTVVVPRDFHVSVAELPVPLTVTIFELPELHVTSE